MRSYHAVPVVARDADDGFMTGAAFGLVITACIAGVTAAALLTSRVTLPLDAWMCTERAGAECVKWERRPYAQGNRGN